MHAISIIVCTFNRSNELGDFLNRLEHHLVNSTLDVEVILVDNNSSDLTPTILTQYKASSQLPVTIVREPRQGANHARNTGIRHANSEILVFTDDDVDFSDTWISDLHDYMCRHPECSVVTGKITPRFMLPRPAWLIDSMLNIYGKQDFGCTPVEIQFPNFPVEMNMAVRSRVFERHGGFSTEFSRDDKTLISNDGKFFFFTLSKNREIVRYIPGAHLYHLIPETRITQKWAIRRHFWQGVSDEAFENMILKRNRLSSIIESAPRLFRVLNQLRGGHISPRRIVWNWHGLPASSKAWYAYQMGVFSRKFGLK